MESNRVVVLSQDTRLSVGEENASAELIQQGTCQINQDCRTKSVEFLR